MASSSMIADRIKTDAQRVSWNVVRAARGEPMAKLAEALRAELHEALRAARCLGWNEGSSSGTDDANPYTTEKLSKLLGCKPADDSKPVVHIAGFPVRIGKYGRQLCGWCGHKLVDSDVTLLAFAPGCEPNPDVLFWPTGGLIEVAPGFSCIVAHTDGDELPANACCVEIRPRGLRLVPTALQDACPTRELHICASCAAGGDDTSKDCEFHEDTGLEPAWLCNDCYRDWRAQP